MFSLLFDEFADLRGAVERIVDRLNESDTCDECGGYVIDLKGTWSHKPSCSRRTGPQREPDGTWSPCTTS